MPIRVEGLNDLISDINRLSHSVDVTGAGSGRAKRILRDAAEPIHSKMKANTATDPKIISGALHAAINIGPVRKGKKGPRVTIGVHRKDWHEEDYYPAYVEYVRPDRALMKVA